jgi:hypothetical protein
LPIVYIVIGVVGGLLLIASIVGVVCWLRRNSASDTTNETTQPATTANVSARESICNSVCDVFFFARLNARLNFCCKQKTDGSIVAPSNSSVAYGDSSFALLE